MISQSPKRSEIRVLFILEYFAPYKGGVERLFSNMIKQLSSEGAQCTVITGNYSHLSHEEECFGARIVRINAPNRYLFSIKAIKMAIGLAAHHHIIHTSTYTAALPAWIASIVRRKPCILTVHEYWGKLWWKLPFLKAHHRFLFWLYEQLIIRLHFSHYVGVSEFTTSRLSSLHPSSKVSTIYNGLTDENSSLEQSLERTHYLFVGRLGVSKGLDILIPAIQRLYEQQLDIKFTLVIPDQPKIIFDYIQSQLAIALKHGNINILHDLSDEALVKQYTTAKAVIIPSYSEGFGFVAAEAMKYQTPIIHSGKGALAEIVGGKNISISPFDQYGLCVAILVAENEQFQFSPRKYFPISKTTAKYTDLYNSFIAASN
jgi:glycosyltransferase involved in cell wall biosynthesis